MDPENGIVKLKMFYVKIRSLIALLLQQQLFAIHVNDFIWSRRGHFFKNVTLKLPIEIFDDL